MARKQKRERVERGLYRSGDVYYACATPLGERQASWRTLGRVGVMEARRLRDEFAVQVRRDRRPLRATPTTFGAVAQEWLAEQRQRVEGADLGRRTYEGYESGLRLHCLSEFGDRRISSIGVDDLVRWHRELQRAGYAPDSIHAWWTPLRLVLAHAVRHGVVETSPADRLLAREKPGAGRPRRRFLTREEMAALLASAPPRYRLAIALGLFCGLRLSEVLGLVWADIDFARHQISVRFQMDRDGTHRHLKTPAARRDVILMDDLAVELRRHRLSSPYSRPNDLVLATANGRMIGHRNLTARGLNKAAERAEIAGVTFHALRHTFASVLISQGRDPVFVARQLGHTNPAVTLRVYAHLFDAARHAREAREQMSAEYRGLLRESS
jgi:integrase